MPANEQITDQLIGRTLTGDAGVLGTLVTQYRHQVYGVCRNVLRRRARLRFGP